MMNALSLTQTYQHRAQYLAYMDSIQIKLRTWILQ